MNLRRSLSTILFTILFLGVVTCGPQVFAQSTAAVAQADKQEDETNLDTQVYLLVGTNQPVDDSKIPAALDAAVKQLRASLQFKNYRLAVTLVNRVKNDGRLYLKWIGGPMGPSVAAVGNPPSFSEFKINNVKLVKNAANQQLVRIDGFGFSVRIPITTPAIGPTGITGPVVNYESTGLNTDFSMREGEATIIGTLNIGPSGDAIILVMSAKSIK